MGTAGPARNGDDTGASAVAYTVRTDGLIQLSGPTSMVVAVLSSIASFVLEMRTWLAYRRLTPIERRKLQNDFRLLGMASFRWSTLANGSSRLWFSVLHAGPLGAVASSAELLQNVAPWLVLPCSELVRTDSRPIHQRRRRTGWLRMSVHYKVSLTAGA